MNTEELLTKLPASWSEVTIADFQKLTECIIDDSEFAAIQNDLEVISKLTGESIEDLEQLPMKDINQLANKLSFMLTPPEQLQQPLLKPKELQEITYNDFIAFLQVQKNPMQNLALIVKTFNKSEYTEADILAMPIAEFTTFFLSFKNQSLKSLKPLIRSTRWKVIKLTMKGKLKGWLRRTKK